MLRKLLKYEFRSIGRQLVPLYLGVLGLAVVNHFLWALPSNRGGLNQVLGGIPAYAAGLGYFALCVALCVVTLLLIIQRFYKGLLTEEGYLMFTLPCRPWQLIAAKSITAAVMTAVGTCVGILSIMLMAMNMSDWGEFLRMFSDTPWGDLFRYHALWPLYIVEVLVLMVVGLFNSIGHLYAAIALGHLSSRHRVSLAIAAYIGINIAGGVVLATLANLGDMLHWGYAFEIWIDNISTPGQIHFMLLLLIGLELIPTVLFYVGTNWILSRKLNLE